jgi:hypothetical protein
VYNRALAALPTSLEVIDDIALRPTVRFFFFFRSEAMIGESSPICVGGEEWWWEW